MAAISYSATMTLYIICGCDTAQGMKQERATSSAMFVGEVVGTMTLMLNLVVFTLPIAKSVLDRMDTGEDAHHGMLLYVAWKRTTASRISHSIETGINSWRLLKVKQT